MKRHYYISDNLDELEAVEHELEDGGVSKPQMHVLSENDADVEQHHLHEVEAVLKQDVVHGTEVGAVIGVIAAALVLGVAWLAGWPDTVTWVPFIFLAVVLLGFCTWEGGLFGIQVPHQEFRRFRDSLREGKHVFFVDVNETQEPVLARVIGDHPQMQLAGVGGSTPSWVIGLQQKWRSFTQTMP